MSDVSGHASLREFTDCVIQCFSPRLMRYRLHGATLTDILLPIINISPFSGGKTCSCLVSFVCLFLSLVVEKLVYRSTSELCYRY